MVRVVPPFLLPPDCTGGERTRRDQEAGRGSKQAGEEESVGCREEKTRKKDHMGSRGGRNRKKSQNDLRRGTERNGRKLGKCNLLSCAWEQLPSLFIYLEKKQHPALSDSKSLSRLAYKVQKQ